MSWLGRLFTSAPPPPAPNTVVIPEDVVAKLGGGDAPLQTTIEEALHSLIEIRRRAAEHDAEGLPFWLRREAGQKGEIDESLRDRVTQRHATDSQS
ncbi:MAG TPA: ABC transporter permease [Candidatus Dormibacteraeota bacterium]|jgi:hypothetical protein|nr:ABC transporter permease [Candidatus Dormibacteraeota bacterium]